MRKNSSRLLRALLVLSLAVTPLARAEPEPEPETAGLWLTPFTESGAFTDRPPADQEESARLPTAVNAAVLPDGRVLYWSQLEGSEDVNVSIAFEQPDGGSRSRVLDLSGYFATGDPPSPDAWSVPSPEHAVGGDMTGSDQRHLPDGRVLAIGGTEWSNEDASLGLPGGFGRTELYGRNSARIFDPETATWSAAADMHTRRYYPSLVTLPDGRLLVAGGSDRLVYDSALFPGPHPSPELLPENVDSVEVFDPRRGSWEIDERAEAVLPPFAHLHLLPSGELLYPAAGMIYPPGGADHRSHEWDGDRVLDPLTGRWTALGRGPFGVRSNGFSVLLPLEPPYDAATVLVGGGTTGPWPGTHLATPLTELVRWTPDRPWQRSFGQPLTTGRWHASAVVLPTGEVVVLGGADRDEVIDPGSGIPVRHAELFDPATGRWTRLAEARRDRTLHNTAVLLRDGSILVGGHAPAPAHYGRHTSNPRPLSNNFKDPSFEIFRPPYLFRGPRPVIETAPAAAAHGGALVIETPDASDPTVKVVLSRLPATTHTIDNDQRTVVLDSRPIGDHTVSAAVPGAAVLPPGPYYLFLLKDNGRGPTPSMAEIVQVRP